jgi:hypothetical protein
MYRNKPGSVSTTTTADSALIFFDWFSRKFGENVSFFLESTIHGADGQFGECNVREFSRSVRVIGY